MRNTMRQFQLKLLQFIIATLVCTQCILSQTGSTLKELLEQAEKSYPSIAAKKAQTKAAEKEIQIQKNTIVPSLDAAYQADYATYNNITGMAYPQYLIPISGPPVTDNKYNGVFGSAASLLLNWQPLTFGLRNAQVNIAQQNYKLSIADESNTIFQLKLNVIAVYLNITMADELLKVYDENIARIQTQLKQISSLVVSGIKPGTDTSLFQAELSKATIDLYNIQRYHEQQQNELATLTGNTQLIIQTDSFFVQHVPSLQLQDTIVIHPLIQYNEQLIQLQQANKTAIKKSILPKLNIWSTTYARGSGISYDGTVKSIDGLGFSRYNYGAGVQLSVPILKYTDVKLQTQKQDALIKSYQSQLQQTQLQLSRDSLNAEQAINSSIKVVKETPVQLSAANAAYRSMLSRYNAGLASFADLIQAQYALIKAETDVKQSYLNVWKALLQKTAAKGDVNIFLSELP